MNIDVFEDDPREAASRGAWMTVIDPKTEEETKWKIKLRGMDSPEFERYAANVEAEHAGKKGSIKKAKRIAIEMLAEMTLDWGGLTRGEEDIPFDRDMAKDLYTKHAWLREQVDAFISRRGNFLT